MDLAQPTLCSCNTATSAATLALIAKALGKPDVPLYLVRANNTTPSLQTVSFGEHIRPQLSVAISFFLQGSFQEWKRRADPQLIEK